MDTIERILLIEQTKAELLSKFKPVGRIIDGDMLVLRSVPLDGWLFILSDEEKKELFEEVK